MLALPSRLQRVAARAAIVTTCLLAGPAAAAVQPARAVSVKHVRPNIRKVSLLYVASAETGSLRQQQGHLSLTLSGLDRRTVWFSDRPARETGSFPSRGLAAAWAGFGFVTSPPNAALVYTDPSTHMTRTVILERRRPRAAANGTGVAFAAAVVDPKRVRGDLADHARAADSHPAATLGAPSLFIDDTSAAVIAGCVIQPYTNCHNADLFGANLSAVNLTGAAFDQTYLGGANLTNANLTNAMFNNVSGQNTNFTGANLSNAAITSSRLGSPNFTGANFTETVFSTNQIQNANLTNVNNLDSITGCYWPSLPFGPLQACW